MSRPADRGVWQFSLRQCLVAVAILACIFGVIRFVKYTQLPLREFPIAETLIALYVFAVVIGWKPATLRAEIALRSFVGPALASVGVRLLLWPFRGTPDAGMLLVALITGLVIANAVGLGGDVYRFLKARKMVATPTGSIGAHSGHL